MLRASDRPHDQHADARAMREMIYATTQQCGDAMRARCFVGAALLRDDAVARLFDKAHRAMLF